MKVALVHDWLFHMRGGEKVLEALAEIFPEATIYTIFYNKRKLSSIFQNRKIVATWLQSLPGIEMYYRWLLPFYPWIIKSLKIDEDTRLVISSSHCAAKAVPIPADSYHVCYCHTPMRYLWGFGDEYFGNMPIFLKPFIAAVLYFLKKWDVSSNQHVNQFIANSQYVQTRIKRVYQRESEVIYPPADLREYYPDPDAAPSDYYLVVSAFVPYKRVDLVIKAFNHLDKKLIIVGNGPLKKEYEKLRQNPKIHFMGNLSGIELRKMFSGAKALIFPTEEDFGIVPVEAQACGTPVIAFGKGGALETVKTGIFFNEQTPEAICAAVEAFESNNHDRSQAPELVKTFGRDLFKERMKQLLEKLNFNLQTHAGR